MTTPLVPLSNIQQDFSVCDGCGALSTDPFPTRENGCDYCPQCGRYMTDPSRTIAERLDQARDDSNYDIRVERDRFRDALAQAREVARDNGEEQFDVSGALDEVFRICDITLNPEHYID